MKLYHFTPLNNYQAIRAQNAGIFPGAVAMPDGTLQQDFAVSLTKSESPKGLGIPTGLRIPDPVFAKLNAIGAPYNAHVLVGGAPHQFDHSEVRIRIELPPGPDLVSAKQFYGKGSRVLAALALSASEPYGVKHLTKDEVDLRIDSGKLNVDSLTQSWWYFKDVIPMSAIKAVAVKQPGGFYKAI